MPADELELVDAEFDELLEEELPGLLELLEPPELPDELLPLELELLPLDPLPLLPEPELEPLLEPDLPLPPSLANSGVAAMPSDNNVTTQTIDFLNFNMMLLLKVKNLEFIDVIYLLLRYHPFNV